MTPASMAEATEETVIRRYLAAMAQSDIEGVVDCFAADGFVLSPTYGRMPVRAFYETLFADTVSAEVDIRTIYRSTDEPSRWAAHFDYRWQRRSAPDVATQLIDLFEVDNGLIRELRIVFT
jgi:ketosteroid isomerase-like protein